MHEYYSITELTREFKITTRTLRHYEEEGLIVPLRRGRMRLYSLADRNKLQQILRAKRLNYSLADIAQLLRMSASPPDNENELHQMIKAIVKRRQELRQMQRDIDVSLRELERIEEQCIERLAEIRVNR